MNRRAFIHKSSGLVLSACLAPSLVRGAQNKMDRIAMGTLLFRYRFKQTKPKELPVIKDELTLFDVPQHHRDRFGIRNIEFWGNHFESLEPTYLAAVKEKITAAGSRLVNVQVDVSYDLASANEPERQESLKTVKQWMDAAALLGSVCIRINPGRPRGSVEKSIESLSEVGTYAKSKNLIVITANHFGLEMNADTHVRIVKEAGPEKIYTEPDFGNYPHNEKLFDSLTKIVPYAYIVSAKVDEFSADLDHVSYDFEKCVRLSESLGFKGMYMVAQWSPKFQDIDYEKVGDWVIERLKRSMA